MELETRKGFHKALVNIVREFLAGFLFRESYIPWKNPYSLFGFLWGLPIPLFGFVIHLTLKNYPLTFSSIFRCYGELPLIHTVLIFHIPLFGFLFSVMGTVRLKKEVQIEILSNFLEDFLKEIQRVDKTDVEVIRKKLIQMVDYNLKELEKHPNPSLSLLINQMGEVMAFKLSTMSYMAKLVTEIQDTLEKMELVSLKIKNESGNIETGSESLRESIQNVSVSSEEMVMTSQSIFENARVVENLAEQTSKVGETGRTEIYSFQGQMEKMKEKVENILEKMKKLIDKTKKISTIIDLIEEISQQINLIAVNALIEASVSGELGKRFSVVAKEIRRLADVTAQSTEQIKNLVDEIFLYTEQTLIATQEGLESVDEGSQMSRKLTDTFEKIKSGATDTTKQISQITNSTKEQTLASKTLSSTLDQIQKLSNEFHQSSQEFVSTLQELGEAEQTLYNLARETR